MNAPKALRVMIVVGVEGILPHSHKKGGIKERGDGPQEELCRETAFVFIQTEYVEPTLMHVCACSCTCVHGKAAEYFCPLKPCLAE